MKNKQFTEKLKTAKYILGIQRQNITNEYMCGFYNGMALIIALFESREPEYIDIGSETKANEEE
jgi:hypothetical protein|nr:MAG TPA: hypothetical protein [Caudoviricetes sp.]